ncbi:MAG: hypothetical protein HN348_25290 [Proteobacteria bacterium]|jgi:hypothetical protein|nr:hypothetical protein [Pseudomonadota bacterium]
MVRMILVSVVPFVVGCIDGVPGDDLQVQETGCLGYQTEAMLVDDVGGMWLGCGSDEGLFYAEDPFFDDFYEVDGFDEYLVYDLEQAPDGRIYVAGGYWEGAPILVSLAGATIEEHLFYDPQTMPMGKTQNVALTSDGQVMVDSLTGGNIGYFDGNSWVEAYYWNEGSLTGSDVGYQMSDLVSFGDAFFAVGSVIASPPAVFFPSEKVGATYHFEVVEITNDTRYGALEALVVLGEDHLIAAGADNSYHDTTLWNCTSSCRDSSSWHEQSFAFEAGKYTAIHFADDGLHGIAVGELDPQAAGGFVILTSDGGNSWTHVAAQFPGLTAAWAFDDGAYAVASGGGYFAIERP